MPKVCKVFCIQTVGTQMALNFTVSGASWTDPETVHFSSVMDELVAKQLEKLFFNTAGIHARLPDEMQLQRLVQVPELLPRDLLQSIHQQMRTAHPDDTPVGMFCRHTTELGGCQRALPVSAAQRLHPMGRDSRPP